MKWLFCRRVIHFTKRISSGKAVGVIFTHKNSGAEHSEDTSRIILNYFYLASVDYLLGKNISNYSMWKNALYPKIIAEKLNHFMAELAIIIKEDGNTFNGTLSILLRWWLNIEKDMDIRST